MRKSMPKTLLVLADANWSIIKCNMGFMARTLQYQEYGNPNTVVSKRDIKLETVCTGQVLVQMLAAPINPVDINVIQGVYPLKPKLPAVPGNEGVGVVMQAGPDVKCLKAGDRVILTAACLGTWRTHAIYQEDQLAKIPSGLGLPEAATLTVNPYTAYRMLKDYRTLSSEDCIIQNGANSGCGQAVIQLCKLWGIQNVGIVRDRPDIKELKKYLELLGASHILTEQECRKTTMFKDGKFPRPILGLNCIGGKNGQDMVRHLQNGSVMVTYGGMSRQPVTAATSAFIFRNVTAKGFWITQWNKTHQKSPERKRMFSELVGYIKDGKLKAPLFEMVPLKNYSEVLKIATDKKGFMGKKYIFDLENS